MNGMETSILLREVPLFATLEESTRHDLMARSRRRLFPAGSTLFHEGDPGHTLYVVVFGCVLIQTHTASGCVITHARRGPTEYFGEMALIDGKARMADAVTACPTELLMLDRADFLHCLETTPGMAILVMANLADRLREAARQLESHQQLDVLGRTAEVLLELIEANGVEHVSGGRRLASKMTQEQLAEQVGATRESVNRAVACLKASGAICLEGRQWVILDEERLRRAATK